MPNFKIHTLGCGSAKPSLRHQPSSTVVDFRGNLFMVDCGEGAQTAFMRQRLNFNRLSNIFLTHLHGDHVLGLPGLISSLSLGEMGGVLTIHTFEEGKKIISTMLDFFAPYLSFEVRYNVIEPEESVIFETDSLTVRTVPLDHRVKDVGFVFEEKQGPRHILKEMTDFHQVPLTMMKEIKAGADFVKSDGTLIPNKMLTRDADTPLSYAHLSDTRYMPGLAEKVGPVTLMFHETTYLECHIREAHQRFHSTATQAAMVARDAGAGALLTGHYSRRYKDDTPFKEEASAIFPNVILNREGLVTDLTKLDFNKS